MVSALAVSTILFGSAVGFSTPGCLIWKGPSAGLPAGTYLPGRQSGKAEAFCRFKPTGAASAPVLIGKQEGNVCYFVSSTVHGTGQKNGTATSGWEVATVTDTCGIAFADVTPTSTSISTSTTFPATAITAGVDGTGSDLGLCLETGGEGAGSEIPGQLFLNGARAGQCCWSAGFKEHCSTTNYYYMIAKGDKPAPEPLPPAPPAPPPRPSVPPEPTPPPLEPKGGIFEGRLSFGPAGHPSIMGLTFSTPNTTAANYNPIVQWSSSPPAPAAAGDSLGTLGNSTMSQASCTTSAPRSCYTTSPVVHTCNMTKLEPNTKYYYKFGDAAVGFTETFSFTTLAEPGKDTSGAATVTAIMYGDMGLDYSENTRAMLAKMAIGNEFDFVIHNGDISYADNHIGSRTKPGVAPSIYNDWMNVFYANVSRYGVWKPYMLSPGNHEVPCDYAEYTARAAAMPHWGSNSADMQIYSYSAGPVHVIALSGEKGRFTHLGTAEVGWLEQDLIAAAAARDRGEIGWIVSHVHYPNVPTGYCSSKMAYCCADGHVGLRDALEGSEGYGELPEGVASCVDGFMTNTSQTIEDMFVKYHVDLHLTAHQHVYERTTPVYRYKAYGNGSDLFPQGNPGTVFTNPKYPININNGCPGNVELQDVWMPRPSWSVGLRTNADGSGGSTANNYADFGVVKMTFKGTESATISYISSRNGSTIDEFTILK